jgi:hypothetical protein
VESVFIDAKDRLGILDTGRVALPSGALLASAFGGLKLVGIDLTTDSITTTILFPLPDVAYLDSYLNDIRFDLCPSLTTLGQGAGCITDFSDERPQWGRHRRPRHQRVLATSEQPRRSVTRTELLRLHQG